MPNWTPERRLLSALSDVAGAISHMSQMARETPHARQDALRALKPLEQAEQIMGRDITRQLSLPSIMASTKTAREVPLPPAIRAASEERMKQAGDQYRTLNDAAVLNPGYAKGRTEIWYFKRGSGNDIDAAYLYSRGPDFFEKGVAEHPEWEQFRVDSRNLAKTHALLGSIQETNPETIFDMMQGENWSPRGEARGLIRSKGLAHTSMSVGDIIKIGGKVMMVDRMGFAKLGMAVPTDLERAWGRTLKQAASASLFAINNDVEFLIDPVTGFLQVGMGGEWWSGQMKGTGRHVFRHRKERVDPAYRPVVVNTSKTGGSKYVFDVSGGFGYEAAFVLGLK